MRKKLLKLGGWMEITLLLAMASPISYAILTESQERLIWPLFLKNLLIFVPVMILNMAVKKCRSFWAYLPIGAAVLIAVGGLAWWIGPYLTEEKVQWGLVFIMAAETFGLIQWYYSDRIQKQSISAATMLLFLAAYVVGLLFHNPALCNVALFVLLFYVLLYVFTLYLEKTEEFLQLHKDTKSMPRRRIYGIGRRMLVVFLLLLAIGMMPGIFLLNHRTYTNARIWVPDIASDQEEEDGKRPDMRTPNKPSEFLKDVYHESPAWLDSLFYLTEGLVGILICVFLYNVVHRTSMAFRTAFDENGDLMEDVLAEDETVFLHGRLKRMKKSGGNDVRSRYRRMIKEHRKELPGIGETPTEIEANAGLLGDKIMKKLHEEYELARYGEEGKG